MRFFIHCLALFLLPALITGTARAQRARSNPAEPRERTIPPREDRQAADSDLPKQSEASPPLDRSIAADRLPGTRPPLLGGNLYRRFYASLQVLGPGIKDFYYVRQDILLQFSDGHSTGLAQVLNGGNYGPHPIGGTVSVVAGANYVFFPSCLGTINWATDRLARIPADKMKGRVVLSCRP